MLEEEPEKSDRKEEKTQDALLTAEEKAQLLHDLAQAMSAPKSLLHSMLEAVDGIMIPSELHITLPNPTPERTREFFEIIRRFSLHLREQGTQFHYSFEDWIDGREEDEEETIPSHEFRHIQAAADLGIDLKNSTLVTYFLKSNGELMIAFIFSPPETVDPFLQAQMALAPREPNSSDISVFERNYHERIYDPQQKKFLLDLYEKKFHRPFEDATKK